MNNQHTTVHVSTLTILKVLVICLLLWFLFSIRDIVLLLLISVIISSAIDPLADYLQKKNIPRGLSVLLVYVLFLGIIGMVVALLIPPISQQFQSIAQSDFYAKFTNQIGGFRSQLESYGINNSVTENIQNVAGNISDGLFNTLGNVLGGLVSIITVLAISFYLTAEQNGTKNLVKQLVPVKNQPYAISLVNKIQHKMGQWVLGQLVLSVAVFILTYIGLLILGVEYALVLALVAGVFEVVPYIGPIIAAIPAIFFAFIQDPPLALAVIILYLIVQQIENHLLVPMIMSKSVGLNPVLVIIGVLIGGSLGGLLGAIVAIPLLSGLQVFMHSMIHSDPVTRFEKELED
jgi:predicted PurR-regulated permease PerM